MKDLITVKRSKGSVYWKLQKISIFATYLLSLILFQSQKVIKEFYGQLYTSKFKNLDEMNKFMGENDL